MSKRPVEAGGERPPSRGRAAPRSARHHGASASAQREAEAAAAAAAAAVAAALRDDAAVSSRAAMAARPRRGPNEFVSYRQPGTSEASMHHQPPGDGRFPGGPSPGEIQEVDEPEAPAQPPGGGRPYYMAPWQRRGRPPPEPLPPVAVDEPRYRYERVPGEQRTRFPEPVLAPRMGPRPAGNGGYRTNTTKVERVTTIKPDDGGAPYQPGAPVPGNESPQQHQRHDHQGSTSQHTPPGRHRHPWTPAGRRTSAGSPGILSPDHGRKKRRQLPAFCFTLCCILFWLAVVLVGVAVLTVYLIYRPQPPKLRVTDASLNAGYVDELTVPGGPGRGLALNADLTVLVAITSPNSKINMVLWYMQLDLYFEGHKIGTSTVLPAPLFEAPRTYALRTVDFVVSEAPLSREDAIAWRNGTVAGGPVKLKIVGKFHTQLNFGRWLPYKYWVYPRCTVWMDPPPNGVLVRARC